MEKIYGWAFWIVVGWIIIANLFGGSGSPAATTQSTQSRTAAPYTQTAPKSSAPLSNDNYYTSVDGNRVHSPAYSDSVPIGASAICRDGTYSFSQNRRGTCSHHGGVSTWL